MNRFFSLRGSYVYRFFRAEEASFIELWLPNQALAFDDNNICNMNTEILQEGFRSETDNCQRTDKVGI